MNILKQINWVECAVTAVMSSAIIYSLIYFYPFVI